MELKEIIVTRHSIYNMRRSPEVDNFICFREFINYMYTECKLTV